MLRREATNVLELEVLADVPRRSPIEDMLHAPEHPLTPGSVVTLGELQIRIVDAAGGTWKRARFESRENLDGGQVCLLAWKAERLRAVPMPALGEMVEIPHQPGPMGM